VLLHKRFMEVNTRMMSLSPPQSGPATALLPTLQSTATSNPTRPGTRRGDSCAYWEEGLREELWLAD
jgi:hypothetical protein